MYWIIPKTILGKRAIIVIFVITILLAATGYSIVRYKTPEWKTWKTYASADSNPWRDSDVLKIKSEFWIEYPNELTYMSNGGSGNAYGDSLRKVIFTTQSEVDKYDQIIKEAEERCEGQDFCGPTTSFAIKGIYLSFYYDYHYGGPVGEPILRPVQKFESGQALYESHGDISQGNLAECTNNGLILGSIQSGTFVNPTVTMYIRKLDESHFLQLCATEGYEKQAKIMLQTFRWVE